MLGLLKKRNPYEQSARSLYARALAHVREPSFYSDYGVPDSFDGRFDLLVLHVFMVMERMKSELGIGEDFNQALFDATFSNMDQTLREMGIGDMGVPKHMRRMMTGFNGRAHAYSEALEKGMFRIALRNNLYGTCEPSARNLEMMENYVRATMRALKGRTAQDILENPDVFIRN